MGREISFKLFLISQFLILILCLLLLGGLYYFLNKDFAPPTQDLPAGRQDLKFYSPISSRVVSLTLEINQPDDNLLTFEPDLLISGNTLPNLKILITTNSQDLMIESKKDGTFSTVLELTEGVNYIEAHVFDNKGEERVDQRTVYYSKEKI